MSSENRAVSDELRTAAVDSVRFLLTTRKFSRWTAIIDSARHLGIHLNSLRLWCDQSGLSSTYGQDLREVAVAVEVEALRRAMRNESPFLDRPDAQLATHGDIGRWHASGRPRYKHRLSASARRDHLPFFRWK